VTAFAEVVTKELGSDMASISPHGARGRLVSELAAAIIVPPSSSSMSRPTLSAKLATSKLSGSSWPLRMPESMAAWNAGMSQCSARALAMT